MQPSGYLCWTSLEHMADIMREQQRPIEILLIEPSASDAEVSRKAFRASPMPNRVCLAGDGEEALRILRRQPPYTHQLAPDVILLELNVRRRHGPEVIEEIGRDCFARKIPIVVMAASEADIAIARRYPVHARSYIVKPVNVESVPKIIALTADDADAIEQGAAEPTAAERELSEFSYIVSHDLAAPLRHVTAFSTPLARSLGPEASIDQVAYCEHIQHATHKCQAMLDEILAFSRAQQAYMTIEPCDATLLMEMAMLQLSAEVHAADADITIEPLGKVSMDSPLMTLGFKHALSNAIKFRLPNAPVKINVSAATHDGVWTVQIADNGPGVALDRQEKMFQLFYQDEPEGTFPGVGAGLAILRRIVRRHDGSVRFVEVESGACLELSLPNRATLTQTHGAA